MPKIQEIETCTLGENDVLLFRELVMLFNEVFEEYNTIASDKHLEDLLKRSNFKAIVAFQGDVLLGGLTTYELPRYYNEKSELYIYDFAVKTSFQGKGIGKMLIRHLEQHAKESNVELVFVEAHSEDLEAVKFYESTFGEGEKVDHFNYQIKL